MGDKPSKIIDKAIAEFIGVQRPTFKAGTNATKPPKIDLDAVVAYMQRHEMSDFSPEVEHIFTEGTYTRKIEIPKGVMLIGSYHLESCINIVSKGHMICYTPEKMMDIRAPYMFTSGVGRKMGYALEDTTWCNVIKTDLKTVEDVEAMFIRPEPELELLI